MKSLRQKIIWYTKLVLGMSLLGWVIWQVDWLDFSGQLQNISLPFFGILLISSVADRYLMGFKWNLLLRANGLQIPTMRIVCLYVTSNFLGAFTPGQIGGDAYRVLSLSPYGKNAAVLSTVVLERAVSMLIQLLFVMATLPFSLTLLGTEGPIVALLAIFGSVFIVLLLFLPIFPPLRHLVNNFFVGRQTKLSQKIHLFFSVFAEQQRNWRSLILFFIMTFIENCLFYYICYIVAKVGGLNVSLVFIFSIMPIVMFILRLPISIQGIGLQEGLFVYALSLAGNSIAQGVLASLIFRLQEVIVIYTPGCLLFWFYPSTENKAVLSAVQKTPND